MSDPTPLGVPYAVGQAVVAALQVAFAGVPILDNPVAASDIAEGDRLLVFKDAADSFKEQSGNAAKRTYSFQCGAIARTADARLQAHTDYRAAQRVVHQALAALRTAGVSVQSAVREQSVAYQLENLDVGGALVLGTFTVDYRDNFF